MNRLIILLIPGLLIFSSCYYEIAVPAESKADELIRKSEEILKFGGHTYVLEAYLWRDFMPVSPPDGRPLIAINRLVEKDGLAIPEGVDIVMQYVINKDEVWESNYSESVQGQANIIEKISREGPKWGPDIYVTVISKVVDSKSGETYLLRLEDVYIGRTD